MSVWLAVSRVVAVGMLMAGGWWYVASNERMRRDYIDQQVVLQHNQVALQKALEVNLENHKQALIYAAIAETAVQAVVEMRQHADELVAALQEQTEDFENDQSCRKLNDPLPDDFVEWLRD